jgi:hypothetical protein
MTFSKLPIIFAISHAILTVVVFGVAIFSPVRSGLMPILIFGLDFPISILIIKVHDLIGFDFGVRGVLLVDASLFLVFGTVWFYLIGLILSKISAKIGF